MIACPHLFLSLSLSLFPCLLSLPLFAVALRTAGKDIINGSSGKDTLSGGIGADIIYACGKDTVLSPLTAKDSIIAC